MSSLQSAVVREDEQQTQNTENREQIGYDLSRFDTSEDARSLRKEEADKVPGSRRRARPKFRLSFLTTVCCLVAVAMTGFMLRSYLNLTVISDEIAKLEDEYAGLRNENVKLLTQYESRYDLTQVEEYAVQELGMIKMDRSQVEYVEIASPDSIRAVNADGSSGDSYIGRGLAQVLNAFRDFFRRAEA